MNVLIVEDETTAYENLVDMLQEIDPAIKVLGNTESITQTVSWLHSNPIPDLIFMDIHLSDGSAFSIFDYIKMETPIIFTTAYDEYAIDAFKVNSIDYLLKPIKINSLKQALHKFSKLTRVDVLEYLSHLAKLVPEAVYEDKILLPFKDKLLPIDLNKVSFIYTTGKQTFIHLKDESRYPYSKSLEQIVRTLDPAEFFRANKQFIISRSSVKNITIWFDNRLLITLDTEVPERIYVSKNKASEFRSWMVKNK